MPPSDPITTSRGIRRPSDDNAPDEFIRAVQIHEAKIIAKRYREKREQTQTLASKVRPGTLVPGIEYAKEHLAAYDDIARLLIVDSGIWAMYQQLKSS